VNTQETHAAARPRPFWHWAAMTSSIAALLAGCGVLRSPMPSEPAPPVALPPAQTPSTSSPPEAVGTPPSVRARPSQAMDAKAYRKDAAAHLYELNKSRIYKGKMPPLLYAIGVLDVDIDNQGRVSKVSWKRAPTQAPEVIAEIERTVRNAAPYPVPTRLGRVTYTDVWLWDESGKFQLDTLTEGQL